MTIEQFNNARFGPGDRIIYKGITYDLAAVEFEEALFGYLLNEDSEDVRWARCENCEFIPFEKARTMKKPEIYDKYLRWCDGEDVPGFDETPMKDIDRCTEYEKYLKSRKERITNTPLDQ